jgi:hypothetical protein
MSISCVKTINGDDLIGVIEMKFDETVIVDTPCAIVLVPTGQNQFSVGLAPFLPFSKTKSLTFKKEHIVLFFEAADELKNEYNRVTGKGIVVPKSNIEIVR